MSVGISYADDPEKAAELIVEQIKQYDFVVKKQETTAFAKDFGNSSVNLVL
jgi:small conductance mechanosensitive channel